MKRCEQCGCIVHRKLDLTVMETRKFLVRLMFLVVPAILYYWRITRMPYCARCRKRIAC